MRKAGYPGSPTPATILSLPSTSVPAREPRWRAVARGIARIQTLVRTSARRPAGPKLANVAALGARAATRFVLRKFRYRREPVIAIGTTMLKYYPDENPLSKPESVDDV